MLIRDVSKVKKNISALFLRNSLFNKEEDLTSIVKEFVHEKDKLLAVAHKYKTPFYLFDRDRLKNSIDDFHGTFKKHISRLQKESRFH